MTEYENDYQRRRRILRETDGCDVCAEVSVGRGLDTVCVDCENFGDLEIVEGRIRKRESLFPASL